MVSFKSLVRPLQFIHFQFSISIMLSMLCLFRFYHMYINLFRVVKIIKMHSHPQIVIENLINFIVYNKDNVKGTRTWYESIKVALHN